MVQNQSTDYQIHLASGKTLLIICILVLDHATTTSVLVLDEVLYGFSCSFAREAFLKNFECPDQQKMVLDEFPT